MDWFFELVVSLLWLLLLLVLLAVQVFWNYEKKEFNFIVLPSISLIF